MNETYRKWSRMHQEILGMLPGKKVLILYSGGKDSSFCLDLMLQAAAEFDFSIEAHAGAFPLHRYIEEERSRLGAYWQNRGVQIQWHPVKTTDEALESAQNPCLICQEVRKELMHELLEKWGHDWSKIVLIASYSLWDLVGYSLEHVLSNLLSSTPFSEKSRDRFFDTGQRFYPLLHMKEGYHVFRPLLHYNTPDILDYLKSHDIPILSVPCLYKEYRPKRILETYYHQFGLKFDYDRVMTFAKNVLGLPESFRYTSANKEDYLKKIF